MPPVLKFYPKPFGVHGLRLLLRYVLGVPGWGHGDVLPGCRAKRQCGELPWAVSALECQPGDVWPVHI